MVTANDAGSMNGMHFNFSGAQTRAGRDVASRNIIITGDNNAVNQNFYSSSEGTDKVEKVLVWLKPHAVDYLPAHEEAHSMRTPGTGAWFFDTRPYTIWQGENSSEPGLPNLECVGIPGAGKTTLASAVIESLQPGHSTSSPSDRDDSSIVLYVYFRHDTQSHQKISNVLASLLQQVIEIKGDVSEELYKLYRACSRSGIIPAPDRIINVLRIELNGFRKVFIVVDALDEYSVESYSSSHALVSELERLNARLLITSRHHVDFAPDTFSSIQIAAHAEDIRTLVLNHVKGNLAKIIARTPSLLEEIVTTIVTKAEGMFIIAKLLIESIPDLFTSTNVRTALKMLPTGLRDTYLMTMERILKQKPHIAELGKKALAWVLLAKSRRRLTVLELQHAVSFPSGDATWLGEDLIAEEVILSSCLGLVIFVKGSKGVLECQFAHFTTKEFLNTHWQDYFPDGEKQITETCLANLVASVSAISPKLTERIIHIHHRRRRDEDEEWKQYRTSKYALCVYAATFWGVHAKAIDASMPPLDAYFASFLHPVSPYLANTSAEGTNIIPTISMSPAHYWILYLARFGLLDYLQQYAVTILNYGNAQQLSLTYNDIRDDRGSTALHLSARYGHPKVVEFLLDSGADVNPLDNDNDSPLHFAVQAGDSGVAVVLHLLDRGAIVDEPGFMRQAPIYYAIIPIYTSNQSSPDIIRLLLQHEVDIYRENEDGDTPFSISQEIRNTEIEELLEEYSRTHPPKPRTYEQRFPEGYFDTMSREPQHTPDSGPSPQLLVPTIKLLEEHLSRHASASDSLHPASQTLVAPGMLKTERGTSRRGGPTWLKELLRGILRRRGRQG